MTAIDITKSKENRGWGRERVSAMMDECGAWRDEILIRFSELISPPKNRRERGGSKLEFGFGGGWRE